MESQQNNPLERLRGGIVASCQAAEGDPLHGPQFMAAVAVAVVQGGAVGVRIEGLSDIAEVRDVVDVPIIGLWKDGARDTVYLTPTAQHARAVIAAGSDIVAVDATDRPRPEPFADIAAEIHRMGKLVLADVATVEEGVAAAAAGADAVSSTMSGYTSYSPSRSTPDLELVRRLCEEVDIPVIGEGHYEDPADVRAAIDAGALTVVLGATLTQPGTLTARMVGRVFDQ
ncbi:N-acetylmannosamine-6-phosphate 2-epimerase [Paramicrobacterium sp. CJ85]|uniref:N-acetylmannosamine-6-phosphate 2-epimerase n=1 Tax=Paramicrobacterium sp. CJ85 TaxID=3445355 RepID=UPI003F5D6303